MEGIWTFGKGTQAVVSRNASWSISAEWFGTSSECKLTSVAVDRQERDWNATGFLSQEPWRSQIGSYWISVQGTFRNPNWRLQDLHSKDFFRLDFQDMNYRYTWYLRQWYLTVILSFMFKSNCICSSGVTNRFFFLERKTFLSLAAANLWGRGAVLCQVLKT